ncbi:MAG: VOC family protein [Candidatus Nomurabacteria bacterium]|nr:MAG: VOC family protein [Candidatus Nomurabacteria bacterium]
MRFTNILLWVQENKISEKFYKKLGFEVLVSTDTYSEIQLGEFSITLVNMRDEDEFNGDSLSGIKGKGMYVYIKVDDVDAEYNRQEKIGLKPATKPRNWEWGNREFILKDPDGYKLCFWNSIPQ